MKLRTLPVAWIALLIADPVFGQGSMQSAVQPAKPLTLAQVWRMDATYTDARHGVTFRYPSVWKAETQFGYHAPALQDEVNGKPTAGFGYEEGGFPRGRIVGPYSAFNVEGFGIVYAAVPAAGAANCDAEAASLAETPKRQVARFGGRTFSEYETGEGGMSQSNSGSLYATYMQSVCYLFEIDVATASPDAADDIRGLSAAQMRILWGHLEDIMKSVRIRPVH